MKNLGNLSPARGSNRKKKRLGRGHASGLGKTAGKGHKGQKARKGGGIAPGFEGGQTPLYRRLPKIGFKNANKIEYKIVTLNDLNKFNDGDEVTLKTLQEKGLVRNQSTKVKVLSNGELTKKVVVNLDKLSKSAKEAIAKVGGTVKGS